MTDPQPIAIDGEVCEECGADSGRQHELGCPNAEPTCSLCGRDYEGYECDEEDE